MCFGTGLPGFGEYLLLDQRPFVVLFPSCVLWGVGLCLNVLSNAWNLDRQSLSALHPPPPPLPDPKSPLASGGGFFMLSPRTIFFKTHCGLCPTEFRLGRKSAFPSTPTHTPVIEWCVCVCVCVLCCVLTAPTQRSPHSLSLCPSFAPYKSLAGGSKLFE